MRIRSTWVGLHLHMQNRYGIQFFSWQSAHRIWWRYSKHLITTAVIFLNLIRLLCMYVYSIMWKVIGALSIELNRPSFWSYVEMLFISIKKDEKTSDHVFLNNLLHFNHLYVVYCTVKWRAGTREVAFWTFLTKINWKLSVQRSNVVERLKCEWRNSIVEIRKYKTHDCH